MLRKCPSLEHRKGLSVRGVEHQVLRPLKIKEQLLLAGFLDLGYNGRTGEVYPTFEGVKYFLSMQLRNISVLKENYAVLWLS